MQCGITFGGFELNRCIHQNHGMNHEQRINIVHHQQVFFCHFSSNARRLSTTRIPALARVRFPLYMFVIEFLFKHVSVSFSKRENQKEGDSTATDSHQNPFSAASLTMTEIREDLSRRKLLCQHWPWCRGMGHAFKGRQRGTEHRGNIVLGRWDSIRCGSMMTKKEIWQLEKVNWQQLRNFQDNEFVLFNPCIKQVEHSLVAQTHGDVIVLASQPS